MIINIISIGLLTYVLTIALQNYFKYKLKNGANFTRKIFIGQLSALIGVAVSLLFHQSLFASLFTLYLAIGSLIFYKQ
jgi:hypothetical protein